MMVRTRKLQLFAAIAVSAYVAASLDVAILLANQALHPPRMPLSVSAIYRFRRPVESVSLTTSDDAVLRGWFIQPDRPNGSGVILLHGMADNREGVGGYEEMFLRHGYSVLLPDSRAHGESGGAVATYGVLERNDVRQWAGWLHQRTPNCEYLFGESMGAAIALQASAVTSGLCAVSAESSFATFREIANDRIAQETRLGLWFSESLGVPAREAAFLYAEMRYRINLGDASPLQAIRISPVPALLICGTADDNIPMRHSQQLYRAGESHAQLWVVPGAEHTGASQADPSGFESRVVGWFQAHTIPQ